MSPSLERHKQKQASRAARESQKEKIAELAHQLDVAQTIAREEVAEALEREAKLRADLADWKEEHAAVSEQLREQWRERADAQKECERLRAELDAARRLAEVRAAGCKCGDEEACQFARERDAARAENERLKTAIQAFMEDAQVEEDGPYYEIIVGQIEFNVLRERGGK